MTGWRKRTIMEMAREAGIRDCTCSGEFGCLEAFAKLVREDEREEIAQFIERTNLGSLPNETALHYAQLLKSYATGIRARSNHG
jgi:hypothetical protein